jgi:hypothetical protein
VRTQGKSDFQKNVFFVPVGLHSDINPRHAWVHGDIPDKGGILEMVLYADDRAQRTVFNEFHFIGVIETPVLFFEIRVDVPCVPLFWLIDEGLQKVAASGIFWPASVCFSGRESFRAAAFIEKASHAA